MSQKYRIMWKPLSLNLNMRNLILHQMYLSFKDKFKFQSSKKIWLSSIISLYILRKFVFRASQQKKTKK